MNLQHRLRSLTLLTLLTWCAFLARLGAAEGTVLIIPTDATFREQVAALDLKRYIYLRTGTLVPIESREAGKLPSAGDAIVIGAKARPLIQGITHGLPIEGSIAGLAPEAYALESIPRDGRMVLLITGGDDTGALYGAYDMAERLGVRFYLAGDVLPEDRTTLDLAGIHVSHAPIFTTRGIMDGNCGETWPAWGPDEYLSTVTQLAKQKMNFIRSQEQYWWGLPDEVQDDGSVSWACDPGHFNCFPTTLAAGNKPEFGADRLILPSTLLSSYATEAMVRQGCEDGDHGGLDQVLCTSGGAVPQRPCAGQEHGREDLRPDVEPDRLGHPPGRIPQAPEAEDRQGPATGHRDDV